MIDRFIRGINAAKARKAKLSAEKEKREQAQEAAEVQAATSLSPGQFEAIASYSSCRMEAMLLPEVRDLESKRSAGGVSAADVKAAESTMAAVYLKRCGKPPKGAEEQEDSAPERDDDASVDYFPIARDASGMTKTQFGLLREQITTFLNIQDSRPAVRGIVFTPAELAVLKRRIADLRVADEAAKDLGL